MKAQSTVDKELRRLAKLMKDGDPLTQRLAWEVLHAIRWAREDVKGWQSPATSVASMVDVIRADMRAGLITKR